jgi:hypothetical protein
MFVDIFIQANRKMKVKRGMKTYAKASFVCEGCDFFAELNGGSPTSEKYLLKFFCYSPHKATGTTYS